MTQIINLASQAATVQVSDRLVSVRRHSVLSDHDPHANKTLLYEATDAVVAISFAGYAYIGSAPTDQWIADWLWGRPPLTGIRGGRSPMFGASPKRRNIGQVARQLTAALHNQVPRSEAIELIISGYQFRRGGLLYRPVRYRWRRFPPAQPHLELPYKMWSGDRHRVDFLGNRFRFERMEALKSELDLTASPEAWANCFARAVQDQSAANPGIGQDVLKVVIPPPRGEITVSFYAVGSITNTLHTYDREITFDSHHSPWIIGAGLFVPPMASIGDTEYPFGPYLLKVVGAPHGTGPGPHFSAWTSVPRTGRPR